MYGRFPSFLNKGSLAREDLELVLLSPDFAAQPAEKRASVQLAIGLVYGGSGDLAKAGMAFLGAVDASPNGDSAKEARVQMKKLAETARGPRARKVPITRIAFQNQRRSIAGDRGGERHHAWPRLRAIAFIQDLVKNLKSQSGMLSSHVLRSVVILG